MGEIKKGDLVMVVRVTHDCYAKFIGIPFVVENVGHANGNICDFCYQGSFSGPSACAGKSVATGIGGLQSWLKKIDPPSTGEYDGVPVRNQIPVTA